MLKTSCLAFFCMAAFATRGAEYPLLLVAGYGSNNVVMFDPQSGDWSQLLSLKAASRPRGITIGDAGELYLGLHSQSKDILKFSPTDDYQEPSTLRRQIGRYGPGILAWHPYGIYTSGDTERVMLRIDPVTGRAAGITQKNCCNVVGVLVAGNRMFAGEYFQRSILQYDLTKELPKGHRLVDRSPHLNRPMGMAVGHNGNLYVSNGLEPTVVEFDINTGDFIRTFANLGSAAQEGIYGLAYVSGVERYYLTTGAEVHELDRHGDLLASYHSPALRKGYGITTVPARHRSTLLSAAKTLRTRRSSSTNPTTEARPARKISILKSTSGRLQISGSIGDQYRVSATTNFTTWQDIGVMENKFGTVKFKDPVANRFNRRFYRFKIVQNSQKPGL